MKDITYILILIKNLFGVDIFLNENRLFGILNDIVPNMKSELYMIRNLMQSGIFEDFIQNINSSESDKQRVKELSSLKLVEERFINSDIAKEYVNILSQVFYSSYNPFDLNFEKNQLLIITPKERMFLKKNKDIHADSIISPQIKLEIKEKQLEKVTIALEKLVRSRISDYAQNYLLNSLIELGLVKYELDKVFEARDLFNKLLDLIDSDFFEDSLDLQFLKAQTLYNLSFLSRNSLDSEIFVRETVNILLFLRKNNYSGYNIFLAECWNSLGEICVTNRKYEQSIEYYKKSIKLYEILSQDSNTDDFLEGLCSSYNNLINTYNILKDFNNVNVFSKKLVKAEYKLLQQKGNVQNVIEYIKALLLLAKSEDEANNFNEAERLYIKAINILKNSKNLKLRKLLSSVYFEMGRFNFYNGNLVKAKIYFQEAEQKYSNFEKDLEIDLKYSEVIWYLLLIEIKTNTIAQALIKIELLTTIYKDIFVQVDDQQKRLIISRLISLAEVYEKTLNFEQSEKLYTLIINLQEYFVNLDLDYNDKILFADIYLALAKVQKQDNNLYIALKNAIKAHGIYAEALNQNSSDDILRKLSEADLCISTVSKLSNKESQARTYLAESIRLNQELASKLSNNEEVTDDRIFNLHSDENNLSLDLYRNILFRLRDNLDSTNIIDSFKFAFDLEILGLIELDLYHFDEAEKNFLKSLQIYDSNNKILDSSFSKVSLLSCLNNLTVFYSNRGDWNKAIEFGLKTCKLYEVILIEFPELRNNYIRLTYLLGSLFQILEDENKSNQYLTLSKQTNSSKTIQ